MLAHSSTQPPLLLLLLPASAAAACYRHVESSLKCGRQLFLCDSWSCTCGDDASCFKFQFLCLIDAMLCDVMRCDATEVHWPRLLRTSIGVGLWARALPLWQGSIVSYDERAPVLLLSVSCFDRCRLVWIYCYWEFFALPFPLLLEYSAAASNCSDSCGLTFIVLTLFWMYLVPVLIDPFHLQILLMSTWLLGFPCHLVILLCELPAEKSDTSMNEKLSSLWIWLNFDWFKAEAELDYQGVVRSIAVVTLIQSTFCGCE